VKSRYSYDGHDVPVAYAGSQAQPPYFDHRFSNGIVEVEYQINSTVPALGPHTTMLNLAEGGAVIDTAIGSTNDATDTRTQIAEYLAFLANGTAMEFNATSGMVDGKVLHYLQIGINPIDETW